LMGDANNQAKQYGACKRIGKWGGCVVSDQDATLVLSDATESELTQSHPDVHPGTAQRTVANDLASNMCRAYQPVVENALQFRSQGLPISIAEKSADSAENVDPHLWQFVDQSIQVAYANPSEMDHALRSGDWINNCAAAVRGY